MPFLFLNDILTMLVIVTQRYRPLDRNTNCPFSIFFLPSLCNFACLNTVARAKDFSKVINYVLWCVIYHATHCGLKKRFCGFTIAIFVLLPGVIFMVSYVMEWKESIGFIQTQILQRSQFQKLYMVHLQSIKPLKAQVI